MVNLKSEAEYLRELEKEMGSNNYDSMKKWVSFWLGKRPSDVDAPTVSRIIDVLDAMAENGVFPDAVFIARLHEFGDVFSEFKPGIIALYKKILLLCVDDDVVSAASTNLGYSYYFPSSGDPDYKAAFNCFCLSAVLNNYANAYYKLGDMFRYGQYVDKNEKIGFKYYEKAFHNNPKNINLIEADICLRMGECLLYGIGCDKDVFEAYRVFQISELNHIKKLQRKNPFAARTYPKLKALMEEALNAILNQQDCV